MSPQDRLFYLRWSPRVLGLLHWAALYGFSREIGFVAGGAWLWLAALLSVGAAVLAWRQSILGGLGYLLLVSPVCVLVGLHKGLMGFLAVGALPIAAGALFLADGICRHALDVHPEHT